MRNSAVDLAKAIGILVMILGHCPVIPYMPYRHFIFTFHMPLFFILSGYFYKAKEKRTLLYSDTKHLLIPYFVTSFALILLTLTKSVFTKNSERVVYYIAAMFIGSGSDHSCLYLSHLPNIGAIWFFPALLVCKNVYNYLSPSNVNRRLLISTVIFVFATLIGRYVIFFPFSILSGLSAIVFYAVGDFYKTRKPKITWKYWILGLICWYLSFKYSHLYLVQPKIDLYFIDVVGATTATFLIYIISRKISGYFTKIYVLQWIGRNSMYILCFHLIDLNTGISILLSHNYPPLFNIFSMLIIPLLSTLIYLNLKKKLSHDTP